MTDKLQLYHFPGAICAQKVRVCLAEKKVEWQGHDVQTQLRSPEYLKLNPGGYVPTLVDGKRVLTESRIINEYIDETHQSFPLQPRDPYARARMRLWTRQLDEALFPCIYIVSFVAIFRDQYLSMPKEMRERYLPFDFTKRERTIGMLEHGWQSPYVTMAMKRFAKMVEDMESTLTHSPWLAGVDYTLADVDYTPYLQRLSDLGAGCLWSGKSATTEWFTRVRARPSFSAVLKDWVPAEAQANTAAARAIAQPKFEEVYAGIAHAH